MGICNVEYSSFNKIIDSVPQQCFTVFCDKDNVNFEVILAMVFMFVTVWPTIYLTYPPAS